MARPARPSARQGRLALPWMTLTFVTPLRPFVRMARTSSQAEPANLASSAGRDPLPQSRTEHRRERARSVADRSPPRRIRLERPGGRVIRSASRRPSRRWSAATLPEVSRTSPRVTAVNSPWPSADSVRVEADHVGPGQAAVGVEAVEAELHGVGAVRVAAPDAQARAARGRCAGVGGWLNVPPRCMTWLPRKVVDGPRWSCSCATVRYCLPDASAGSAAADWATASELPPQACTSSRVTNRRNKGKGAGLGKFTIHGCLRFAVAGHVGGRMQLPWWKGRNPAAKRTRSREPMAAAGRQFPVTPERRIGQGRRASASIPLPPADRRAQG